jgi:Thioredoxin domain
MHNRRYQQGKAKRNRRPGGSKHLKPAGALRGLFNSTAPRLAVVVGGTCPQCQQAVELAQRVAIEFPALTVQIINLDEAGAVKPDAVFAVPTYLLNDGIISLGNPSLDEIRHHVQSVSARSSLDQ